MVNILVLEDESYTLKFLEKIIKDHPAVNLLIGTTCSHAAMRAVNENKIDIAFLDIELAPQEACNGLEVAKAINKVSPLTRFVFITGYTKYALDSFSVHPYDYVLKPIKIDKVMSIITALEEEIIKEAAYLHKDNDRLVVKTPNGIIFVNIPDIIFIEKQRKKAIIHCSNGMIEAICRFNELESFLGHNFIRGHKSFIINTDKIYQIKDTGNRSYEVSFYGYNRIALISRNKFKDYTDFFTPSL